MKYTPFELIGSNKPNNIICICDHASNVVPNFWGKKGLGINRSEMERHIAYDLGAKNLTKALSKLLNGPAILSNFSRLVIDPNRGKNDPTLIMKLYDGTIIPENREVSEIEKLRRVNEYYDPYHNAVQTVIDSRKHPIIISIHSFTPKLKNGHRRPWELGVLHTIDRRLSSDLLVELRKDKALCIGDNLPYSGDLPGDTLDQHCIPSNHLHALIELRNDLLASETLINHWANYLASKILKVVRNSTTKRI